MGHHGATFAGARSPATTWRRTAIVAACAALSFVGLVARTSSAHAVASPVTVSYTTVGEHTFVVPAGVTVLHVVAVGGRGFSPNGYGALVTADLTVTPGQTLYAEVGGPGEVPTAGAVSGGLVQWIGGAGGDNGGAKGGDGIAAADNPVPAGGGGGGGASDIRTCDVTTGTCDTLASRILVAGGGGGFGGQFAGGNGGTPDGSDGQNDGPDEAGHGGTQDAGGAPGFVAQPGDLDFEFGGSPGRLAFGGAGANGVLAGGGGGGGGWYGGGGAAGTSPLGTTAAGGGGGSSHGPAGTTYAIGQDGAGGPALPASVAISYTPPGALDHLSVSPASPTIAAGGSQAFTAEGFDAQNVDLGDVTANTTFAIIPDGSCTGATCTATAAGPHTISATDGTATGSATLTITAGPAHSVAATGGTPQFATIGTAFADALAATVTDAYGNPVPGVDVTFTASASGPSGTWNNETMAVVTTGADGVALAPTFTANNALGQYTVVATATGVSGSATYQLENTAASFPYTSQYASGEGHWLYIDALLLHDSDLAHVQHTGAMFMAYLNGLIEGQHLNAPSLGVDAGSGPLVVTTSYTPDENTTVQHAATSFSTDAPSLQRQGVELIAFLVAISQ